MAKKVKEEVGKVSILINNAGVVSGQNIIDIQDGMAISIMVEIWLL